MAGMGKKELRASGEMPPEKGVAAIVEVKGRKLLGIVPGHRLKLVTSDDEGETWSKPAAVRDRKGRAVRDAIGESGTPGVVRLASGDLAMTYECRKAAVAGAYRMNPFIRKSSDEGKTWSKPVRIGPADGNGGQNYDSLTQLSSGRLIFPVRRCFAGFPPGMSRDDVYAGRMGAFAKVHGRWTKVEGHGQFPEMDLSYVYFSDDEGKTWRASEASLMIWREDGAIFPTDEPSVAELANGDLLMVMRTTVGQLYKSVSKDGGNWWSAPAPSGLASSYSPGRLKRIPGTDDVVCLWNQVSASEMRAGCRRCRISSALTRDGRRWRNFKTVVASGVPEARRIAPPKAVKLYAARKRLPRLPEGYRCEGYPNVNFALGKAFLRWISGAWAKGEAGNVEHSQGIVLRRLPIDWFYRR